jgi:hypothetical protein
VGARLFAAGDDVEVVSAVAAFCVLLITGELFLALLIRRWGSARRAAARPKVPRPAVRRCRFCGNTEPVDPDSPPGMWACIDCGCAYDASGEPFEDQIEGKRRKVLNAVAAAETKAPERKGPAPCEQVQAAAPDNTKLDERYQRKSHEVTGDPE